LTHWNCEESELQDLINRGRVHSINGTVIKKPAFAISAPVPAPEKKKSKYNNKKTIVDDITFDSQDEANYYLTLKLLQRAGAIKSFELQPKFVLQPKFKREGKTIRAISYKADFRVREVSDHEYIVDVKSAATKKDAVYCIKKKLLLCKYPGIDFREILW